VNDLYRDVPRVTWENTVCIIYDGDILETVPDSVVVTTYH